MGARRVNANLSFREMYWSEWCLATAAAAAADSVAMAYQMMMIRLRNRDELSALNMRWSQTPV